MHGAIHGAHEHQSVAMRRAGRRALIIALSLTILHMVIEFVGSFFSGSLGLLAHAAHMLTDTVAIGLALFAMWIAERPASITRTFGWLRTEILVVLINALALWGLAAWIIYEAYLRFTEHVHDHSHAHDVDGGLLLGIACLGVVIHMISAYVLHRSRGASMNVEGVFWHIFADMMGSLVLVASGILILFFDWDFVDPLLSFVIAGLILVGSGGLAIRVLRVLLETVPRHIDLYQLCSRLESFPGITLVHDVHVWTITSGYDVLTAHVLVDTDYPPEEIQPLLRNMRQAVREEFGLRHITLQVEQSMSGCEEENHHVDHLTAHTRHEA